MSLINAIDFAQQTLSAVFAQQSATFILSQQKIAQCLTLLSDDMSKVSYMSELSYLMLRDINRPIAGQISPFTPDDWQKVTAQWEGFLRSGRCPKMICAQEERSYLINMLMTTFIAEQYRYGDIVKVESGDIFLDCGACFGDTALWAYDCGAAEVYSFEPSPGNFEMLKQNMTNNGRQDKFCFNCAVGKEAASLPFAAGPGMAGASHLDEHGNIWVDCIVLDDWAKEHKVVPDFLKYDIEGSEVDALNGSRELITKYHPKLAVCLYHKCTDMWEIPLLIHSMVPEYRFYCRKNNVHNEFILYAVVPEQIRSSRT